MLIAQTSLCVRDRAYHSFVPVEFESEASHQAEPSIQLFKGAGFTAACAAWDGGIVWSFPSYDLARRLPEWSPQRQTLGLEQSDGVFTLRSTENTALSADLDSSLLLRLWRNGVEAEPVPFRSRYVYPGQLTPTGKVSDRTSLTFRLSLENQVVKVLPGDRVAAQVLLVPAGWRFLGDTHRSGAARGRWPEPQLSNRVEWTSS